MGILDYDWPGVEWVNLKRSWRSERTNVIMSALLLPLFIFAAFLSYTYESTTGIVKESHIQRMEYISKSVFFRIFKLHMSIKMYFCSVSLGLKSIIIYRGPVRFRIPENFDVKGAKLDSLKQMLEDRAKWLQINSVCFSFFFIKHKSTLPSPPLTTVISLVEVSAPVVLLKSVQLGNLNLGGLCLEQRPYLAQMFIP
ncbi:unnamed protein product [Toxocara canis]|uniref:Transmembrane protein 231 n=1 Tax=Toxocara canis TaxID=6265 RepID=A0A183VA68_TOXCA|nr:unnamed protein product [Toxocara canis]